MSISSQPTTSNNSCGRLIFYQENNLNGGIHFQILVIVVILKVIVVILMVIVRLLTVIFLFL